MPPAVLFLVINYLSFSLVLNSNSVGQISDVAYPHLHQASSLHKYPRSGPFVFHSLNPSAVPSMHLLVLLGPCLAQHAWRSMPGGLALHLIFVLFLHHDLGAPSKCPSDFKKPASELQS